jgi:hypothetical protein
MSAISPDTASVPLYSHRVRTDRRSFFFDVKRSPAGGAYMTVSQFVRLGDEWVRLKLVLPSEDAKAFYLGLCEAIKALRNADSEPAVAPPTEPEPAVNAATQGGAVRPPSTRNRLAPPAASG